MVAVEIDGLREVLAIGFGAATTYLAGQRVGPLVESVRAAIATEGMDQGVAADLVCIDDVSTRAGAILGQLERALFFMCFWFLAPELAGGWLLFKVGSKWQVWNSVVRVPAELPPLDERDYLRLRHVWATRTLMSFLIGTLANLLAAAVGVLVGNACM